MKTGNQDGDIDENNNTKTEETIGLSKEKSGKTLTKTTKDLQDPPKTEIKSFADTLYDEITETIGGENPNQFFCMSLPGTILEPNQYSYDVENNEIKPGYVENNESKLANKLYDPFKMTGSDNGRHLSS